MNKVRFYNMSWKNVHNVVFLKKHALGQMTGSGFIDEPSLGLLVNY